MAFIHIHIDLTALSKYKKKVPKHMNSKREKKNNKRLVN